MSSREGAAGDLGGRQPRERQPGERQPRERPSRDREPRQPHGRDRQPRERRQARGSDDAQSFWAGYDLLWGVQTERPAARRSPLDRGRIVRAAIRIGDAEGLEAVSMRRIARELRTGAMSLYRHVPDKDALISLMIDEVIGEEQIPVAPSGDWRDDLRQVANQMWALAQRHPWYPEAVMERPPVTPHGVAALEYTLSILDGYGLAIGDRVAIVMTLSNTVTAVAINAAAEARTRARLRMTEDEMMSSAGAFFARIVESGEFPRFGEFLSEMMTGAEPPDGQYELRAAVELILDGVAARLESARPEPARGESAARLEVARLEPARFEPAARLEPGRPRATQ